MSTTLRLLAVIAVLGAIVALLIFRAGGQAERTKAIVEQADAAIGAAQANKAGAIGAAGATNDHAARAARLQQELADARRRLEAYRNRPAAPGTIGPAAVVDPAYGLAFLCDLERVRGDAPSPACRAAPARRH